MATVNPNPLHNSIGRASQDVAELGAIYSSIGIGNRNGTLRVAYEQARKSYREAGGDIEKIRVVSRILRAGVESMARNAIRTAFELGRDSVKSQLGYYGVEDGSESSPRSENEMIEAVLGRLDAQTRTAEAFAALGEPPDVWLGREGDQDDAGFISVGAILNPMSDFITSSYSDAWEQGVDAASRLGFLALKMAVAIVDGRTTKCCLAVHGQIRPFFQPFHLTQPPAWEPYKMTPPFHNYCRTGMAIYVAEFDDGITEDMEAEAGAELDRRGAGSPILGA